RHGRRVPVLVKVAPDLSDEDIDAAARVLGDLSVDGVIATNPTVSRIAVQDHPHARQAGGLSGEPLMNKSTAVLRMLRTRLPAAIPLVGVGGILSGADAAKKMAAGEIGRASCRGGVGGWLAGADYMVNWSGA